MPSATARDFQRVASQIGFVRRRQTGSHERWNHPDGRAVTIPIHGGPEIGPPLFYRILRLRPASDDGVQLGATRQVPAAFAIWNGANQERDGFKAVTLEWWVLRF